MFVASWNVRTLLESSGAVRVCRKRVGECSVDTKLDLLVSEFKRYRVGIAGVQETKWFQSDVWPACGGTFVHSGCPLPVDDESGQRGKGVGIYFNNEMTRAWKRAGETWSAASSRIVSARFHLSAGDGSLPTGFHRSRAESYLTVVNVYAPTSKAPPHIKNKFMDDLQLVIDAVPRTDRLVFLVDFNARVVVNSSCDKSLSDVVGPHGIGQCNAAGEDLLVFCNVNRLSVMNTWFRKKFYGTWMHPATKEVHLIDYVVVRADQRSEWHDVQVMRGANCWSEHSMVRGKFSYEVGHKKFYPVASARYRPIAVARLRDDKVSKAFSEKVSDLLPAEAVDVDGGVDTEQEWAAMRKCVVAASSEVLGYETRRQPDWFRDSVDTLRPLIERKNAAHQEFLQKDTRDSKLVFRTQQRAVQRAVNAAKEVWIERVATHADNLDCHSRMQWECVRQLQEVNGGRKPARPLSVLDENGNLTTDPAATCDRWQRHFDGVLNITSQFSDSSLESLERRPTRHELDNPPTHQ